MVVPEPGLPTSVTIYEVGPRDGLQNESVAVPTATPPATRSPWWARATA